MTVRRRFLPVLAYFIAAMLITGSAARGQGPGQADRLPGAGTYTAEQFRRALEGRSGAGMPDIPPELLNLFKDQIERQGKGAPDEQQLKKAAEMMQANPKLREQIEEMGKRLKQGGGKSAITDEERKRLAELLQPPKMNEGPPPVGNPNQPKKDGGPPPVANPGQIQPLQNPMFPGQPPPQQMKPDPLRNLDPKGKNGLDKPDNKAARAAASMWERNIGPLDETPAVKKALFELIEGTEDLQGPDGKSFWEELALEEGDSTPLSDLLDDASLADSWSLPKFDLPDWKLFGNSDNDIGGGGGNNSEGWWSRNFGGKNRTPPEPRAPSSSSSGSGSGFNIGIPGVEGGWLPVVILAALLFGGLLVWKFWGVKWSRNRAAAGLYGPDWPIDPRRITTREHVVIAFEYLSVLICGPSAKTWTHNTIADALADLAKTHGETAVLLARLYELARYAPLDEPLTTSELAEARRLVCALAGLEHE